jgi:porin
VANPIKYAYNVGLGAKRLLPWRPCDNFGIGWARTVLSGNFVPLLHQQLQLGLGYEDAIELYYNAAIHPGLSSVL